MKVRKLRSIGMSVFAGMLILAAGTARANDGIDYPALKHLSATLVAQTSRLTDYGEQHFQRGYGPRKIRRSLGDLHEHVHEFQEKLDYYGGHRVHGARHVDELARLAAVTRERLRYAPHHSQAFNLLTAVQITIDDLHALFEAPVAVLLDWDRVQSVAHQVEEMSRNIYEQSRHELRYSFSWFGDGGHERTLDRLDDLKDEARHLHSLVEKGRIELRHFDGDFSDVVEAYNRAATRIHHVSYRTRREFERLGRAINELDAILHDPRIAGRPGRFDGDRSRGSEYGRGRSGDDGRWSRNSSGRRSEYL